MTFNLECFAEKGSAIVCWMATTSNLNLILLATEKNIFGEESSRLKKYTKKGNGWHYKKTQNKLEMSFDEINDMAKF